MVLSLLILTVLAGCSAGSSDNNQQTGDVSSIEASNTSNAGGLSNTLNDSGGDCQLSVLDDNMLNLINELRSVARQCGNTHYSAVSPVKWSCTLKTAASSHSSDMGSNNFFSHTGSDGLNVGHRVSAVQYEWAAVGENLAAGQLSEHDVVSEWLESPSHCATLMSAQYDEVAVAVNLPSDADYLTYWALVMALPF
mgnify:CR=1 FL=1